MTGTSDATATGTEYVSSGNNADFVKLIKEAAIFKYPLTEKVNVTASWKPAENKMPLGYFSEDGLTIHPETGDSNDFKGHNGNTVLSWVSGGYWTFQFAGIESKKEVLETYFDADEATDGSITVSSAECNTPAQYVIAALTQTDNLVIIHIPKAKVGEREDVPWKISELMSFGMTLRTFNDASGFPYFFKVYGLDVSKS